MNAKLALNGLPKKFKENDEFSLGTAARRHQINVMFEFQKVIAVTNCAIVVGLLLVVSKG